jgi:hypothetical protein
VAPERAGRCRAHERTLHVALHGALQHRDVFFRTFQILHADRTNAARRVAMLARRVFSYTARDVGKVDEVVEHVAVLAATEAVEAILDVRGVTRLRHFTVVDDVDADVDLLLDDVAHFLLHALVERGFVDGHAVFFCPHHQGEVFGAREAADMGRQKAVGTA